MTFYCYKIDIKNGMRKKRVALMVLILFLLARRLLIDTGEPDKPDYISLLKETLGNLKTRLEHVLITHWHYDHIGGVKEVELINPNNGNRNNPMGNSIQLFG